MSLNVHRDKKQNMGDAEKGYFEFGDYNNRLLDNLNRVTEDTFEVVEALGELLNSVGELAKVVVDREASPVVESAAATAPFHLSVSQLFSSFLIYSVDSFIC